MKNEGGLTQSEQVRQAIRMNAEDADMPFKGELTEAEKDTLGIFPTQGQVMEFRNNERINRERQRRERIAEENRRRSEQEPEMFPRSAMSEGGTMEEVVVQETRPAFASESPGGGGTSGRGFGQAAAKGILSGLNPLNTLKLLDGVARGDITPQEAATNLIPGKPLAMAIKAKQRARIEAGEDIVGKG